MSTTHNDKYYYESDITDPSETPMAKRERRPVSPSAPSSKDEKQFPENYGSVSQGLNFSFIQGLTDEYGMPLDSDDFYGHHLAMGFYGTRKYPFFSALGRDTNTTTTLRYYDTSYQKTPIDTTEDSEPNLSRIALDSKEANLWNIQDWSETAARRILEKTHRIQYDPDRKLQAQILSDIQKEKAKLVSPKHRPHPTDVIISYDEMMLKIQTMLLNRTTDVLDYLEKQYVFSKYEVRPKGINFYTSITLQPGAQPTKLNFQDERYNLNVPQGTVFHKYPYHNLYNLTITYSSGPTGGKVFWATNMDDNDLDTYVEFDNLNLPASYIMDPGQAVIWSLNLRATGSGPSVVNLVGFY